MYSTIRLLTPQDAGPLARLITLNRAFLQHWEPLRSDAFFTEAHQRDEIAGALARHAQGVELPYAILDDHDALVGRITVSNIVRGAFQSASLGYWLAEALNGRGLVSAAVRSIVGLSFDGLGLHRLQAATLVHNARSRRVLERAGFEQIGLAPRYLRIAGAWQDHVLYQKLNERDAEG